jgi:hypothetical protein
MAITIETITVTRPMKVIAFTCCTITVFLMVASAGCSDWVQAEGWREGLFTQCIKQGAPTPLPFGADPVPGCRRAHSAGYVRGSAALVVICVLTDFFGTLLTGLGLRSTDPNKKYKYYRVAIYSFGIAVLTLFLALVIYPTSFSKDIGNSNQILDGGRVRIPKNMGSMDFDGDGIMDHLDSDDDNDGQADDVDLDDDNDGIPDDMDDDDDNDGIPDDKDGDNDDMDGDGVIDSEDDDDDNDGIPDHIDTDDDNDGISDINDDDDDNDGIPDAFDNDTDGDGIVDAEDNDDDGDGISDAEERVDADGDGVPDDEDNDDDNDGIPDNEDSIDSDGDGISDDMDADDDGDGIADDIDDDDDNDGIPDSEDISGHRRHWEFGFGYGSSAASFILMFASLILLICDRESEEIFYKEREVEAEEGAEEE